MPKESPKRCPNGYRKDKNGVCKKHGVSSPSKRQKMDELLLKQNPFRKDKRKRSEEEDERLFDENPFKGLPPPLNPKKTKIHKTEAPKPAKPSPKLAEKASEKPKPAPKPKTGNKPFLGRNVRAAAKRKVAKRKIIDLGDSDTETESESDGDASDISDLIADESEEDEKLWREELNKYVKAAREGKLKDTFD